MSDLYRLRELAALFKPKAEPESVQEGAKANSDFAGIKRIVDDALADLHDKLSEGGSLETLLDKAGLTDLDKNKDSDGATMLERLAMRTAQFKKEVDKLMTEVELMLTSDMSEGINENQNSVLASMKPTPGMKRAGLDKSKKDPAADHDNDEDNQKIEAHGVRGMKSTQWRKTFKNRVALDTWVDKMDGNVEIYGTRKAD